MIVEIVVAIILAWALILLGKKLIRRNFYDPIGKARRIIESRPD